MHLNVDIIKSFQIKKALKKTAFIAPARHFLRTALTLRFFFEKLSRALVALALKRAPRTHALDIGYLIVLFKYLDYYFCT